MSLSLLTSARAQGIMVRDAGVIGGYSKCLPTTSTKMTQISRTEKFGRWQSLMRMVTRDQKYHNGMIDRHLVAFGGKDKTKCCISFIRKTQKKTYV